MSPSRSAGRGSRLRGAQRIIILTLVSVVVASCAEAPGTTPKVEEPARPVLLVGLDGATWDLIHPWIVRGALPNLERLRREGAWGVLRSFDPKTPAADMGNLSPVIWTSIATGRSPEGHGILGFHRPGGEGVPYTNADRRCRAVWNIVSERGEASNVVGWFTSWPVDVIEGSMISDRSRGPMRGGHFPPDLAAMLERTSEEVWGEEFEVATRHLLGPPADLTGATRERRSRLRYIESALDENYRIDRLRLAWTLELMRQRPARFTAVFFKGIDVVSHLTWIHMEPELFPSRFRPHESVRRRLGPVIRRYYEFMDDAVGRLLEATPRDANIVVVSDHGFGPGLGQTGDVTYDLDSILAGIGWTEQNAGGRPRPDRSLVVDLSEHWQETKRHRTLAVNGDLAFNGAGTLESRRVVLRSLSDRLSAVKIVEGIPFFEEIRPDPDGSACLADGRPCELLVKIHPGIEEIARSADPDGRSARLDLGDEVRPLTDFVGFRIAQSGAHRLDGVVVMAGPDVERGREIKRATVYDVAPTLLRMLGLPRSAQMSGRVLTESIRSDRLPEEVPPIASYERGADIQRVRVEYGPDVSEEEHRLMDALRGLGYVD